MALYNANQLNGAGTPIEALNGGTAYLFSITSSACTGSAYFTVETVRNSSGYYGGQPTNAIGSYYEFVSINQDTLITSSYISSVVVPEGISSYKFIPILDVAVSSSFLRGTGGISGGVALSPNGNPVEFIISVQTDNSGGTNEDQFKLSWTGTSLSVDWGDGTVDGSASGARTHTYATPGYYVIKVVGGAGSSIQHTGRGLDNNKIIEIQQWGVHTWGNLNDAFTNCFNIDVVAVDRPNLSAVTDMSSMFGGCTVLVGNISIGQWDVSNVTDMNNMFRAADAFNQPIGDWDVSSVTNMEDMFSSADTFNQNINSWDVSNVTDMSRMFYQAEAFNQPIGNWDVSNVTQMDNMFGSTFGSTTSFNQDINSWDVSSVTNMGGMFGFNEAFDQPIGSWDISSVTSVSSMFYRATSFNQNINNWDVSNLTGMVNMFREATSFNQDISSWDVGNVTNMGSMFRSASSYNQNLSSWDVVSVTICGNFSTDATSWTLPQPNLTNCTP